MKIPRDWLEPISHPAYWRIVPGARRPSAKASHFLLKEKWKKHRNPHWRLSNIVLYIYMTYMMIHIYIYMIYVFNIISCVLVRLNCHIDIMGTPVAGWKLLNMCSSGVSCPGNENIRWGCILAPSIQSMRIMWAWPNSRRGAWQSLRKSQTFVEVDLWLKKLSHVNPVINHPMTY